MTFYSIEHVWLEQIRLKKKYIHISAKNSAKNKMNTSSKVSQKSIKSNNNNNTIITHTTK
jgi:hypothetical protein